jgi:uncharacterized protein (DUF433 family)
MLGCLASIEGGITNTGDLLERVTIDENVLRGKAVIRGLRISVEMILCYRNRSALL